MKKKIITLIFCLILSLLMISPIVYSKNINYLDKTDRYIFNYDEYEYKVSNENYRYGLILTYKDHEINNHPVFYPTIRNDLPEYFNWRDHDGKDWTSSAKDQGNCGSCWLCAALGVLESVIKIREGCCELNIDLSEQYVLSCLPFAGDCDGGWAYNAFKYIFKNTSSGNYCNGIIPEFCFPYQLNDTIPCSDKCYDWEKFLIPITDYGYWRPDGDPGDIDLIKTQVMEKGPVTAVMMATYYPHGINNLEEWGWEHNNPDDYYPYPGPVDKTNHQVVIVGWKDNPSIANGGYWIVKNSFSEEWGYDGFFNIEYGSLNIDSTDINWIDYNPEEYNNWIPIADANGSYYGKVKQEILFDGSNSKDHEGEIMQYLWDFGQGEIYNSSMITYSFSEKGIYPIKLTVIDNEGFIAEDLTWVFVDSVNNPPDKPILKGPSSGKRNILYDYTFYAFDPDGDDVYYYIVWGDTYWEGWWEGWIGPYSSGEKITLKNSWDSDGNYTVRVKAKDIYGFKSDWSSIEVKLPRTRLFNILLNRFQIIRKIVYF